MANTKPSAFTSDSTPDDLDTIPYIDIDGGGAGVNFNRKLTFTDLTAYLESRGRRTNCSIANQTPTGATDTYLVGSDVAIPYDSAGASRVQLRTRYRMSLTMSKTAAGVASAVLALRIGTAASTADTARATLTFGAQSAAIDTCRIDLDVYFRAVGSGTTAVIRADALLDHQLATTGWTNVNSSLQGATSAGFDSTAANLKIGCSIICGSATVATITSVGAELFNLA